MPQKICLIFSETIARPETRDFVDECCRQAVFRNGDLRLTDDTLDFPFENMAEGVFKGFDYFNAMDKLFIVVTFDFEAGTVEIVANVNDRSGHPLCHQKVYSGFFTIDAQRRIIDVNKPMATAGGGNAR